MVGHDAAGQQPGGLVGQRLGEDPLKSVVIAVVLEERQAAIGPVEHMVDPAAPGGT